MQSLKNERLNYTDTHTHNAESFHHSTHRCETKKPVKQISGAQPCRTSKRFWRTSLIYQPFSGNSVPLVSFGRSEKNELSIPFSTPCLMAFSEREQAVASACSYIRARPSSPSSIPPPPPPLRPNLATVCRVVAGLFSFSRTTAGHMLNNTLRYSSVYRQEGCY